MTEIRGRWGNAIALPAKCQGWGEFALSTLPPCLWFGGEAFAARADAVGGWLAFIPPPKATRDF